MQADVSHVADVTRLLDATTAAFRTVSILVNNAAIYRFATLEDSTEAEAATRLEPNGGSMVDISSVQNMATASLYIASIRSRQATPTVTGCAASGSLARTTRRGPSPTRRPGVSDEFGWITGDVLLASGGLRR